MPWCPECKTEYKPEFDTCSDCGVALVQEMPEKAEPSAHRVHRLRWRKYIGAVLFALIICAAVICGYPVFASTGGVEPLGVALILAGLCIAGFVFGIWAKLSIWQLLLGWWLSSLMMWSIMLHEGGGAEPSLADRLYFLLSTCIITLVISIPTAMSAHLANCWRKNGRTHLFIWLFLTVMLFALPFMLQFYAQTHRY
ncbi:MAG: hypothetical protein NT018_11950 [Armatimonadetes bacterium]|nr:hypothetical protein [Armatimonadota bacterium]